MFEGGTSRAENLKTKKNIQKMQSYFSFSLPYHKYSKNILSLLRKVQHKYTNILGTYLHTYNIAFYTN